MKRIKFGARSIDLPRSKVFRIFIGAGLVLCGLLGFLPVLGFWMIPLGLIVLSVDFHSVRRFRRRALVWLGQWLKTHYPALAVKLGFGNTDE